MDVNGEKRTTVAVLMLAVLSLILAGVCEPRIEVEAKARQQSQYVIEDLSTWLLRFATWVPADAPAGPPECNRNAVQSTAWGLL
jgi:hypothetical protein